MRVLIVGAGAVGLVYARHLVLGGAEVALYVREKYAAAARAGFDLYPLNRKDARAAPVRLDGLAVLTTPDEVARGGFPPPQASAGTRRPSDPLAPSREFDALLLCVSSTALRAGEWLEELARASGGATIVALQPGVEDREFVLARVAEARVATGMIGVVSYLAPLPGEQVPRPGVAYWLPPLVDTAIAGPRERAAPVVDALRRGGCPASLHDAFPVAAAFGGPVLGMHVDALEAAGWSLERFRRGPELALAGRALREAHAMLERRLGVRRPLAMRLLRPWVMRLGLKLAPRLVPFDLEQYIRAHFTKVGDQMRFGLKTEIALAKKLGTPSEAMEAILARIGEEPAKLAVPERRTL